MSVCVGQPVSWLRLEQYVLDELAPSERTTVDAHLSACEACRTCLDHIGADPWRLPALEAAVVAPHRTRMLTWLMGGSAVVVAAVIALLILRPGSEIPRGSIPGPRVAIKGAGTVAIELVRERGGSTALDPARYESGDRFKVLVTCAPGTSLHADAVFFQDGVAAFPLDAQTIACGNRVPLRGAFRVTGTSPFTVCAVIGDGAAPDRAELARRSRATGLDRAACTTVSPTR